jgi:hypothetical protein
MVGPTDLETPAAYEGCGQVTRQRKLTDNPGKVRVTEGTVYGWKPMVLSEARTQIPLAVKVVPIHEPEGLSMQALVTQARMNLAGHARLHNVCTTTRPRLLLMTVYEPQPPKWMNPTQRRPRP